MRGLTPEISLNSQPPTLNQYDFDGNLTSGQLPTGSAGLVWDGENRLIAVNVIGQDTIHYAYDSQSRRISRSVGVSPTASSTIYIYDAWNVISEYSIQNSTFNIQNSYLWGTDLSGSMQGAGGVGGLLSVTSHSALLTSHFPTYDGNGNVSEYLAPSGIVAAHFEYDPFGNTIVNTSISDQFAYRFSTKPQDQVTSLYYYGYRYYDPATGRWLSRDPIEEKGGVNLYGFVRNDCLDKLDYIGLASTTYIELKVYTWVWTLNGWDKGWMYIEDGVGKVKFAGDIEDCETGGDVRVRDPEGGIGKTAAEFVDLSTFLKMLFPELPSWVKLGLLSVTQHPQINLEGKTEYRDCVVNGQNGKKKVIHVKPNVHVEAKWLNLFGLEAVSEETNFWGDVYEIEGPCCCKK